MRDQVIEARILPLSNDPDVPDGIYIALGPFAFEDGLDALDILRALTGGPSLTHEVIFVDTFAAAEDVVA